MICQENGQKSIKQKRLEECLGGFQAEYLLMKRSKHSSGYI